MENSYNPTQYLYAGDVSMTTTGMPGTFYNALSVASVDNSGYTGMYLNAGGSLLFYAQTEYSNEPMTTLAGEQTYLYLDGFGSPEDFAALGSAVQGKIVVCSGGGGISFYEKRKQRRSRRSRRHRGVQQSSRFHPDGPHGLPVYGALRLHHPGRRGGPALQRHSRYRRGRTSSLL